MSSFERQRLQTTLGYTFKTSEFQDALTHRSGLEEMSPAARKLRSDYQRLEFLGDAALQLIVSVKLLARYPNEKEGELSKRRVDIVREATLADLARQLRLDHCVEVGRGVRMNGIEDAMLCDLFESVMGAMYQEAGLEQVQRSYGPMLDQVIAREPSVQHINKRAHTDPKGYILERYQAHAITQPVWASLSGSGITPQDVMLSIGGDCFYASAQTRKQAEAQAARFAIAYLDL